MNTKAIAGRNTTPEASKTTYTAPVDVYENQDEYLVLADVPGAKRDGLSIAYHENQLRLNASVHGLFGDFDYQRILNVGPDIDPQKISAELERGILKVHLPKSETAKPREIPVTVA